MKKLLLILGLILMSSMLMAQSQYQQREIAPDPYSIPVINVTPNSMNNGWGQYNQSCAGCASIFYQITRSQNQHRGPDGYMYYYYYFFFYSNSYYGNGAQASSYLTNIEFRLGYTVMHRTSYLIVPPGQTRYAAWIRTTDPNAAVNFIITNLTVY